MKARILIVIAGSAVLLSSAGHAQSQNQPAPGTFAIEQYIISITSTCLPPNQAKQTLRGVLYYPGPDSLGATMRIAHNEPGQFLFTIVNNLPRTPATTVTAVWSGGFSGFIAPPTTPPTPFNGTLSIGTANTTTITWIDSSTFLINLKTTTYNNCNTESQITGWRTNLNQAPLH